MQRRILNLYDMMQMTEIVSECAEIAINMSN